MLQIKDVWCVFIRKDYDTVKSEFGQKNSYEEGRKHEQ